MRKHNGMRPQDIAVLLKLVLKEGTTWRYADLASELCISQSEVAEALGRCRIARLVDESKRKVFKNSLLEFLIHGFRYVFPVVPGALTRGIPTAHSAPPLLDYIISEEDAYVWPSPDGELRGQSIFPLYKNMVQAAQKDPEFYALLALLDGLRVGRAREFRLACEELTARIKKKAHV